MVIMMFGNPGLISLTFLMSSTAQQHYVNLPELMSLNSPQISFDTISTGRKLDLTFVFLLLFEELLRIYSIHRSNLLCNFSIPNIGHFSETSIYKYGNPQSGVFLILRLVFQSFIEALLLYF